MKIKVLASGSKGNCSLIETASARFLIDIGITYQRLKKELEKMNLNLDDIDALLLTHAHNDHTSGLKVLLKHTNFKIYANKDIIKELTVDIDKERIELYDSIMHLNSTELTIFKTSHDAKGSVGFLITDDGSSLVYITDTGYLNRKYFKLLTNRNIYYIESNHDEKMLMDGPYPYYLKQRILSDEGHLSNETTSKYLKRLVGDSTKYIILAHLSEHNNKEELAYTTTRVALQDRSDIKILVAKQNEALEEIEVMYDKVNMCR
ncbi:MAG TPA: MBL fold metallo-hydrolase [Candidatus Onthousia excrementipullorum]|uniref:MBL fold metallo-hydrolase n=1 Tax=Candidatus Onthousia excrementipullorum TaxID=2840884 RepID=A0A9D1DV44_9FIRM|nr:MBL fold metallo-hydrolase [Candidatus Onthousia excrementipullorum]